MRLHQFLGIHLNLQFYDPTQFLMVVMKGLRHTLVKIPQMAHLIKEKKTIIPMFVGCFLFSDSGLIGQH